MMLQTTQGWSWTVNSPSRLRMPYVTHLKWMCTNGSSLCCISAMQVSHAWVLDRGSCDGPSQLLQAWHEYLLDRGAVGSQLIAPL